MFVILFNCNLSKLFDFTYRMQCYVCVSFFYYFFFYLLIFFGMDYCPWLLYYHCLYKKNRCKIGNNTIIWKHLFAMGRKLFWNFILKKKCILWLLLTCVHLFMHELLPLNINFYVKNKREKYHILFNRFQFIYQIAIKNVRQLLYISLHVQ